jgi:hypothetical protein
VRGILTDGFFCGIIGQEETVMFTPVMELEGTWEEIAPKIPKMNGQKLRVSVAIEEEPNSEATLEFLHQIAAETIADNIQSREVTWDEIFAASGKIQSKPDPHDWLQEGRAGGMFSDDNV